MRERPIIFSGPMVRAILDGRKTQTRRPIKNVFRASSQLGEWDAIKDLDGMPSRLDMAPDNWEICPYGVPGEVLWVRETFYIDQMPWDVMRLPKERPRDLDERDIYYRADGECCQQIPECACSEVGKPRWRPSIHMPRWAARLFLRVTAVRVERVQEISAADCEAEGAQLIAFYDFQRIWDSLNAKRGYGWDANPWVWVVNFERAACT